MLLLYGHHKVKDYKIWKSHFDKDEKRRSSFGIKTKSLMCSTDDPNEVHFVFKTKDLKTFYECINDPIAQEIMVTAGVLERPVMNVLNEI